MRDTQSNLVRAGLAALLAASLMGVSGHALAQKQSGGGKPAYAGNKGKEAGKAGGAGNAGGSLRDVFKAMEDEARGDDTSHDDSRGGGKPAYAGSKGKESGKGGSRTDKATTSDSDSDDDSDRPEWAGVPGKDGKPGRPNPKPGISKGGIYGDLYVILRDENGLPILDGTYVQVYYYDASGNLVCCIPRDPETGDLDPAYTPIEVELGRLNVGRSPTRVLSTRYEDAVEALNAADSITVDASGRLVMVYPDGTTKTIDSPLENLAFYVELLNTGTLAGLDPSKLGDLSFLVDGVLTPEDLTMAASFLAAASDKSGKITLDEVVYMNTILSIDGTLEGDHVDYSSVTYDRASTYGDATVEVLVQQPDGSWLPQVVNIYDAVFSGTNTDGTNVDGFTKATDDARAVIEFVHEYEVPEDQT